MPRPVTVINIHEEYAARLTVLVRDGDIVLEIQDQHNQQHGVYADPIKAREIITWIEKAIVMAEEDRLRGATGRVQ